MSSAVRAPCTKVRAGEMAILSSVGSQLISASVFRVGSSWCRQRLTGHQRQNPNVQTGRHHNSLLRTVRFEMLRDGVHMMLSARFGNSDESNDVQIEIKAAVSSHLTRTELEMPRRICTVDQMPICRGVCQAKSQQTQLWRFANTVCYHEGVGENVQDLQGQS